MKIECPLCHQVVPPNQVNIQTDLAFCPVCNEGFKISENSVTELNQEILLNPPKGTWFREEPARIVLGATTRSPIAIFLVPFMMVWSGGSLGGIYGTQILHRHFNLGQSLFGIPFLIGTVFIGSAALMATFGKVEISIGRVSTIFTGIGSLGWTRRFNWLSVKSIREDFGNFNENGRPQRLIYIEGDNTLKFGSGLTENRRSFILNKLKYLHAQIR